MFDRRLIYFVFAVTCLCTLSHAYGNDELDFLNENSDAKQNSLFEAVKRFWKKAKTTTTKSTGSGALDALIKTTPSNKFDVTSKRKSLLPGQTRATVGPAKDACGVVSPCQNGGTCRTLSSGRYYCFCSNDYYGKNCDKKFLMTGGANKDRTSNKDHCASNPCRNSGECVALRTTYYCRCKSPFYGTVCDKKIGKREIYLEDNEAATAAYKRGLEDNESATGANKRGLEDNEAVSAANKRGLEDYESATGANKRGLEDNEAVSAANKRGLEDYESATGANKRSVEDNESVSAVNERGLEDNEAVSAVNERGLEDNEAFSAANKRSVEDNEAVSAVNKRSVENYQGTTREEY